MTVSRAPTVFAPRPKWKAFCTVYECFGRVRAKGLCSAHYERVRVFGTTTPLFPKFCEVMGCLGEHHSMGYCRPHYQRFRKHGTPDPQRPGKTSRFRLKSLLVAHPDWSGAQFGRALGISRARVSQLLTEMTDRKGE